MGLLLFSPAGTLHFPRAWLLLALFFVPMTLVGAVLLVRSPALLEKRLNMRESEPEQRGVLLASAILLVLGFVTAGLDFRYGFTPLPWAVSVIGALLFLVDERASGFVTGVVLPVDGGYSAYSGV